MAIRTTVMGPNSVSIAYEVNTALADIFVGVDAAVVSGGWTMFDSLSSTSKVYRAAMVDDSTVYKYVKLTITSGFLQLVVYESWNATTHVGTNLAYNSDNDLYSQVVNLVSGGYLFMFTHPRWLVAYSRTIDPTGNGSFTGNAFSGCFEIMKENAGEVTGVYPRFAWMNGALLAGNAQTAGTESPTPGINAEYHHYALPRMRNGDVGLAASKNCILSNVTVPFTNRAGMVIPGYCNGQESTTKTVAEVENSLGSSAFPISHSAYSTNGSPLMVTPYAYDKNSGVRGAFYGLKMLSAASGVVMDNLDLKVGANFKPSVFGTSVTHVLLGITLSSLDRAALPI